MMMVMLMVVVTAAAMLILMMMVVMLQFLQLLLQSRLPLHGLQQLCASELIPGRSNQCRLTVMLPQQRHGSIQLGLGDGIGTGQNDRSCGFNLIVVELAKVLHIHLDLACIRHSNGKAQHHIGRGDLLHGRHDVGQLTHAGGLDDDPVGVEFLDNLLQGLAEITYQATANTAGVHFGDVDAGILQEAAVNADFAEFVLNQHQLLTGISFLNHLFNQSGFACAQEAAVNIDFCHGYAPSIQDFQEIIPHFVTGYKEYLRFLS